MEKNKLTNLELEQFVRAFLTLERAVTALYSLTTDIKERVVLLEEKAELIEKSIIKSDTLQ